MAKGRVEQIRRAILTEIFWSPASPVSKVARAFDVTPQAVQRHVRTLVQEGMLRGEGQRRHRRYHLTESLKARREYDLSPSLTEDLVWDEFARPRLSDLSVTEQEICQYGLTEIINNAIDHSEGHHLRVDVRITSASVTLRVTDDGVGMFQKIADALALADPREALLELSKGKFTTDPSRHTGEGIFFTSRSFDRFSIRSDHLVLIQTRRTQRWRMKSSKKKVAGTRVTMSMMLPSDLRLENVFKQFSSGPEDYRFAKTHVPLKLATFGDESLISRSSARRVLSRVDRFDEVVLDFAGVRSVGQGFADEMFRVFATAHPGVRLIPIHANEQVTRMIRRAQSAMEEGEAG